MKSGVCVGNVPALSATNFLRTREPEIAKTGIIVKYRANSIAKAKAML